MVTLNASRIISKIFLRFGQVPLGGNPDAKSFLDEITLTCASIPDALSRKLIEDDVFSLSESYGDSMAGDPSTFDFLRVTTSNGDLKEVEVFNLAVLMFSDNREETRRLFRIINAIKDGEQDAPSNGG
jgi:hypothetical protein